MSSLLHLVTTQTHPKTVHFIARSKLKDSIDPNMIVIDPSPLLNPEIDNIRREFQRLLKNLKRKLNDPDSVDESLEGTDMLFFVPTSSSLKLTNKKKNSFLLSFHRRAAGGDPEAQ